MAKKKVSMSIPEDKKEDLNIAKEGWVRNRDIPENKQPDRVENSTTEVEKETANTWSTGRDIPVPDRTIEYPDEGNPVRGFLWLLGAFLLGWLFARIFKDD